MDTFLPDSGGAMNLLGDRKLREDLTGFQDLGWKSCGAGGAEAESGT